MLRQVFSCQQLIAKWLSVHATVPENMSLQNSISLVQDKCFMTWIQVNTTHHMVLRPGLADSTQMFFLVRHARAALLTFSGLPCQTVGMEEVSLWRWAHVPIFKLLHSVLNVCISLILWYSLLLPNTFWENTSSTEPSQTSCQWHPIPSVQVRGQGFKPRTAGPSAW